MNESRTCDEETAADINLMTLGKDRDTLSNMEIQIENKECDQFLSSCASDIKLERLIDKEKGTDKVLAEGEAEAADLLFGEKSQYEWLRSISKGFNQQPNSRVTVAMCRAVKANEKRKRKRTEAKQKGDADKKKQAHKVKSIKQKKNICLRRMSCLIETSKS